MLTHTFSHTYRHQPSPFKYFRFALAWSKMCDRLLGTTWGLSPPLSPLQTGPRAPAVMLCHSALKEVDNLPWLLDTHFDRKTQGSLLVLQAHLYWTHDCFHVLHQHVW